MSWPPDPYVALLLSVAAAFVLFVAAAAASFVHRVRLRRLLQRPLALSAAAAARAGRHVGADGAAATTVLVADALYNVLKLDPHALQGLDQLHHARSLDTLADLVATLREDTLAARGNAIAGDGAGVAEALDPAVGGHALDADTNLELAAAFGDDPRVVALEGLSTADAYERTDETLTALEHLGDAADLTAGLDAHVPLVALAVNVGRQGRRLYQGRTDARTAAEHALVDTAATGVGVTVGGKLGLGIGLALAPSTGGLSLVLVPASALIGSLLGVGVAKGVGGWFKGRTLRAAHLELQRRSAALWEAFDARHADVVGQVRAWFDARDAWAAAKQRAQSWLGRSLFPNLSTLFLGEARARLAADQREAVAFYEALRTELRGKEESERGLLLYAHGPAILNDVVPLPALHAALGEQIAVVRRETERLGP